MYRTNIQYPNKEFGHSEQLFTFALLQNGA